MRREEFTYKSSDGRTNIRALKWIPDGEVVGILQIVHGMVEHIERYDEFASFMASNNYVVYGNDHLGHGKSVTSERNLGYFAKDNGNKKVITDIDSLRNIAQDEYKDIPYYILGHSMGSFLTRQYIIEYGKGISGAVVMGTGYKPSIITLMGMLMCSTIAKFKGWYHRSDFINNMGMGGYNKKFGEKDGKEWLSKNNDNVKRNLKDPLCNFQFTLNGYYNLFKGLNIVCKKENIDKMPKDLPVYFVSGDDDPVGDYGKSVNKVYELFMNAGMKNLSIKLYEGDRHEILNEDDRQVVFTDILNFIKENN